MGAWLGREQRHLMAVRTRSSKLLPALDVGGRGNLFVPRGGRSDTHRSLEEVVVVVGSCQESGRYGTGAGSACYRRCPSA
jgi:hypothetical protein